MAEGPLQVELVAADRTVWSGEATMVIARTVEGDVGILKDHTPILSLLAEAVVEITAGDETVIAAVDGGFISVAHNRVSILSEHALLADEIDRQAVESELEEARGSEDDDAADRVRRAEAQLRALERVG
jgi:F-type H+-transporting ATPase subunit epsilon